MVRSTPSFGVLVLAGLAIIAATTTRAAATTIVVTHPEITGLAGGSGMAIALLEYSIPGGEIIVSATIEGTFGNSERSSTAPLDVLFGGQFNATTGEIEGAILVASCSAGEPCTVGLPTPMEPWSYDFASDELDAVTPDPIDGGNRLWLVNHPLGPQGQAIGITTLTIATVPEPGTAALLAMGLVALCVWRTASG